MAFIAATSDSDKLRLAGLSALQVHSTVAGQGIVVVVVVVVVVITSINFIHQLTTVVAL